MRDECFIRGDVPMTKSEVRAVSLSKLELRPDDIVYDIGAGTGSVSVEAALAVPQGRVYAFEQKEEGCRLIAENGRRFGLRNLTVIPGRAPASLSGDGTLPVPDKIFVGGSGGEMTEILDTVRRLNPAARIVANMVSLESLARLTVYLKERDLEAEVACVQVSRARRLGGSHLFQAQNPVYVVTLEPDEKQAGQR